MDILVVAVLLAYLGWRVLREVRIRRFMARHRREIADRLREQG